MSDLDDLDEIAEQLKPGVTHSRWTKKQRDAARRAGLNGVAAKNSPEAQERRAMDRRRPIAKTENQH
jgi:hypothetical protein